MQSASAPLSQRAAHIYQRSAGLAVCSAADFWSRPEDTSTSFPAGTQTRSIESEQRRSARQRWFFSEVMRERNAEKKRDGENLDTGEVTTELVVLGKDF